MKNKKEIENDNKELLWQYGQSLRTLSSLKVIKFNGTKFQAQGYFSQNSYSKSLSQLFASSKILNCYKEMLFLSLKQIYIKTAQILTVLQWMSPPFKHDSIRPADQQLLKLIELLQQSNQIGPIGSPIYIIEIERLLKVIQYDHKEVTLRILNELCIKMECLAKGQREYVFYDKFFAQLFFLFQIEDQNRSPPQNVQEYKKKVRLEQAVQNKNEWLRQIGVVNHEVNNTLGDISDVFYDSILDLLQEKGNQDYGNYQFLGFSVTITNPITITSIYANPLKKSKFYLRNIKLTQMIARPQSAIQNKFKYKEKYSPSRPQSAALKSSTPDGDQKYYEQGQNNKIKKHKEKQLFDFYLYFAEQNFEETFASADTYLGEYDKFQGIVFKAYSQSQLVTQPIRALTTKGKTIKLEEVPPFKIPSCYVLGQNKNIYGAAKPVCFIDYDTDSDLDSDEMDLIDKPMLIDPSTIEKMKQKQESVTFKKDKNIRAIYRSAKKQKSPLSRKQSGNQDFSMIQKLLDQEKDQNEVNVEQDIETKFQPRTFEYDKVEFSSHQSNKGLEEELITEKDAIEINFLLFGSSSSIVLQVYSVSCDIIRAIRICFPDEGLSAPLIDFPYPQGKKESYDLHVWKIAPLDNLKGIQIHKRRLVSGQEVVKNFILIVQDNVASPLTQYDFEYLQNQQLFEEKSILERIMPVFQNNWRRGQFKIYLNYLITRQVEEDAENIVTNLRKLDQILEQMFPQMIVIVNQKKLRNNTVFEVFLQGMGRPQQRDHYDRYYFSSLNNWSRVLNTFDLFTTDLIDNILILIWSYGGVSNLHQQEIKIEKVSSKQSIKSYPYKFVQTS